MARKVTRLPAAPSTPSTMLEIVDAAVVGMTWLSDSDQALVGLARAQADTIDTAEDRDKAVGWIGPQLLTTLKAMGGTPAERKALGVESEVKGKLAALRAGRGKAG